MEPSFDPNNTNDDPWNTSWISADNSASTELEGPPTGSRPALALPPLLAPPPPEKDESSMYIEGLEKRLLMLKKKSTSTAPPSNGSVHHVEIGEKEVYKTRMEAETEPLMDDSELTGPKDENGLDPVFHPRYGSLAATKISTPEKDSESDDTSDENDFGALED